MAFDGGFLYKTVAELKTACDCHVDKIYQPSRDELVFLLRKKGFTKRLLITAKPGAARLHFTENKFENPQSPPMFCMLIRKYLSSARLIDITQPGMERVAELIFTSTNEMGDVVNLRLICEFIGNQANIILVNENGRIIDSLRHSDVETSSRLVLPGALYTYPERQDKLNPLNTSPDVLCNAVISQECDLSKALLNTIDGFSPLICREITYACDQTPTKDNLKESLCRVIRDLSGSGTPLLLLKEDGNPFDYTYSDINQYGNTLEKQIFESYSELLDRFFSARENSARIHKAAQDIIKLINNLRARTEKKLALRLIDLKKCEKREQLRINGELIKANLYSIENGSSFAEVQNYYDDDLSLVRVPLNPAISPSANAARYFKEYKKTYTAEQTLTELTEKDREELIYFDSVLDSISRCTSVSEISEIRDELAEAGYIKRGLDRRKQKSYKPEFKEFFSVEGYKILVGKNNKQNDYITTVLAQKNDMWFHVKNIPGSHVVVLNRGEGLSDETILTAATIAAANSKASNSAQVPVDYTPVKNVKKPNGAKPGMVIYTTNKTVYVTPDKN